MPLQATSGAASYDGFGGGVAAIPNYIEEVFSTYLYTGTGASQTITNGIDLSTKGGLVWQKDRSQGTGYHHILQDTARGATNCLFTNLTNAQSQDSAGTGFVFNNNGFTIGSTNVKVNASGDNYVSWTFRKQPKFFDVVTYTGDGNIGRTVSHSLNATVGFMLIKCTSQTGGWVAYHRSVGASQFLLLNATDAASAGSGGSTPAKFWNSTAPTSTVFSLGDAANTNETGQTYVAYLFAHDAGGFGLTGTDNVISCGSMDGAEGTTVTLGYEPQLVMYKAATTTGNWIIADTMRGFTANGGVAPLRPNLTDAEGSVVTIIAPNATGFSVKGNLTSGQTYIYIAIRRGPMKVPTTGTSVFSPVTYTGNNTNNRLITSNFPVDMSLSMRRDAMGESGFFSRLTGNGQVLFPSSTAVEDTQTDKLKFGSNLGSIVSYVSAGGMSTNQSSDPLEQLMFSRAPSFFDVVCYTGTGSAGTVTHNLGAVPELIIVKSRSNDSDWPTYHSAVGNTKALFINNTNATNTNTYWNNTTPTSSVFSVGTLSGVNFSGRTYIAYLFSTCASVSKVGSYTGTGTTKQIDCGFTAGARFVLIKRTDSTGDWYLYDSARGITSGNDPYVLLNSTAAEVTNTDYIDTYSAGFEISSTAPAAINASGGTFIYLAIA